MMIDHQAACMSMKIRILSLLLLLSVCGALTPGMDLLAPASSPSQLVLRVCLHS